MAHKTLMRSKTDSKIAGICGLVLSDLLDYPAGGKRDAQRVVSS